MLLSTDRRNIYLGITKTGTNTVRNCLENLSTKISKPGAHPTYVELVSHEFHKTDVITPEEIATCNFYAVWRDPVERFASAVSFMKRRATSALMFLLPEKFPNSVIPHNGWMVDYSSRTIEEQQIIDTIGLNDVITNLTSSTLTPYIVLQRQSNWLRNTPNIQILPFSDFESSVRTLYTAFGGVDAQNLIVPKLNSSPDSLLTDCDSTTRQMIMDYYQEDYSYEP
jgi:hypothetical protein